MIESLRQFRIANTSPAITRPGEGLICPNWTCSFVAKRPNVHNQPRHTLFKIEQQIIAAPHNFVCVFLFRMIRIRECDDSLLRRTRLAGLGPSTHHILSLGDYFPAIVKQHFFFPSENAGKKNDVEQNQEDNADQSKNHLFHQSIPLIRYLNPSAYGPSWGTQTEWHLGACGFISQGG